MSTYTPTKFDILASGFARPVIRLLLARYNHVIGETGPLGIGAIPRFTPDEQWLLETAHNQLQGEQSRHPSIRGQRLIELLEFFIQLDSSAVSLPALVLTNIW